MQADLVSQLPVKDENGVTHHTQPPLKTSADYANYIKSRTAKWKSQKPSAKLGSA